MNQKEAQNALAALPLIRHIAEHGTSDLEFLDMNGNWGPATGSWLLNEPDKYRIKPKPVTRPWSKPDDVPVNCWLRKVDTERFMVLIIAIRPDGVRCSLADGATQVIEWDEMHNREWSTDLKSWHPCTVTEEPK